MVLLQSEKNYSHVQEQKLGYKDRKQCFKATEAHVQSTQEVS